VRWAETFLIEPDDGEPWKFFDYQRESVRSWMQNVIHQDGAEVGKTREITVLILWAGCTGLGLTLRRPWILVGAPQQTHLDEIILAVEEQVGATEDGGSAKGRMLSQFWRKPKRTPHTMHRFLCPALDGESKPLISRVYYRPAGHDGEAFRGVHVNGLGLVDEAAKMKRKVQWTEFWRALKPGCRSRVYSVPDGDRTTDFFKQTQSAITNLAAGKSGTRLFHWPKMLMPPPFWTPERDVEMIQRYGGRHDSGYVRNVLGEWGNAENPVWSWDVVLPNVIDVPEYRVIKLNSDRQRGELALEVKSIKMEIAEGRKHPVESILQDTVMDLAPFLARDDDERRHAMHALLADYVMGAHQGVFWGGADLGESNDPTEILISEEVGLRLRDNLRVHAKGLPYQAQRELLYCLQMLYSGLPHWGVDLGSAGTVVVKDLQTLETYEAAHFDETMTGFQFSNAVDCIDEKGEALYDARDEGGEDIVRAPAKHWATQCISSRAQQIGFAFVYDNDMLNDMTNHTSRQGAKWPIYSKKNDHTIDARRVQMLRKIYDEAASQVDVFSSGVSYRRNAA
jgi:hypothetical protein